MILTDSTDSLTLTDAWDFKRLSFETAHARRTATEGVRWLDDDHVVVSTQDLRRLAGDLTQDESWETGFDAMLAYARSKGWVDADGGVRIHVAFVPTES